MTWLVWLYPPAWRRRYGRELSALIAAQPASFRTAMDLVAGAVDAWVNPQTSTALPVSEATGGAMLSQMLHLKCNGHGPDFSAADGRKAAAITIGGSLAAAIAYVWTVSQNGGGPYVTSLFSVSWLVAYAFSQRFTSLKGRSGRVQAVLIGGQVVFVVGIALGAAWISTRIND